MIFVGVTTLTAGRLNIRGIYLPQLSLPGKQLQGIINLVLTTVIMASAAIILIDAIPKWFRTARKSPVELELPAVEESAECEVRSAK